MRFISSYSRTLYVFTLCRIEAPLLSIENRFSQFLYEKTIKPVAIGSRADIDKIYQLGWCSGVPLPIYVPLVVPLHGGVPATSHELGQEHEHPDLSEMSCSLFSSISICTPAQRAVRYPWCGVPYNIWLGTLSIDSDLPVPYPCCRWLFVLTLSSSI
jgi:hypothetical protein